MEWFLLAFKRYAEFNGRSRRKEYWMFYLIYSIISFCLSLIDGLIGYAGSTNIGFLSTVFGVTSIIPWISITVRRFHDVNKSTWNLLWYLFPIIGWIYIFILTIRNGDVGENQYGPDPKNPTTELDDIGVSEA